MNGEQPGIPPPAFMPAEPERVPFWGYADVFLIAGLALPCMFAGYGIVRLIMWAGHLHASIPGMAAVTEMLLGYVLLFGTLAALFRVQYDRPFWRSLGWTSPNVPVIWCVTAGCATTITVGMVGWMLHTPPSSGPLIELMQNRTALVVLAIFGSTAAPLFEELAFRGFLQPLLIRNLGVAGGIALASALFGSLHFSEYGDSWRSALLVALAGAAFGCMRYFSGSTAAAAIMHASFNGLQFVLLIASKSSLH